MTLHPRLLTLLFALLATALLGGCVATSGVVYKTGTELVSDDNGSRYVTYVTPKQFAELTDLERRSFLYAVSASQSFRPKKKPKKNDMKIDAQDLLKSKQAPLPDE